MKTADSTSITTLENIWANEPLRSFSETYDLHPLGKRRKHVNDLSLVKRLICTKIRKLTKDFGIKPLNIIRSTVRCFNFVLFCPKTDLVDRREALRALVPHINGNHTSCCKKWCSYDGVRSSWIQSDVQSEEFNRKLEKTLEAYIAVLDRLLPRRSRRLQGQFRSKKGATVMQKKSTFKVSSFSFALDIELYKDHLDVNLDFNSNFVGKNDCVDGVVDRLNVPLLVKPTFKPIQTNSSPIKQVFFDIETTSLSLDCDIIQISAKYENNIFNVYIVPSKPIAKGAAKVTGLSMSCGQLCYKGKPINAIAPFESAKAFLDWLDNIGDEIILYGHNCRLFDCPRLLRLLQRYGLLNTFSDRVLGFVDTLSLFRDLVPGQPSYRQEALIGRLLGKSYEAHNALEDVRGLSDLLHHVSPETDRHLKHSFTTLAALEYLQYSILVNKTSKTLQVLVSQGVLSKGMAHKAAQTGISLADISEAFHKQPENGVTRLFSEKICGNVRVTSSKRVLKRLQNFLEYGMT